MNSQPLQSLNDWINHIQQFNPADIEMGLGRVRVVAEKMGLLSFSSKIVLIAGTNGKGSTVAMLESIALNQGKRVGCYTSPHLLRFNERIKINGQTVIDSALIESFNAVEKARDDSPLTFFEFTTLAALHQFKTYSVQQQNADHLSVKPLDLIILEVGLGGRQDATNIFEPDLALITTVDLDHADWLGDDLVSIAYEKAGIIRQDKPAYIGDQKTFELVNKACPKLSSQVELVSVKLKKQVSELCKDPRVNHYQLLSQNISLAVAAYNWLFAHAISKDVIKQSLANIQLNGRFQAISSPLFSNNKTHCIADVAHNQQSAANLAKQLKNYCQLHNITSVNAICGMMRDKAINEVLTEIDPLVKQWHFVDLDFDRAISADDLLKLYRNNVAKVLADPKQTSLQQVDKNSYRHDSVKQACLAIDDQQQADEKQIPLVLVFGSFITVANMLQYAVKIQ